MNSNQPKFNGGNGSNFNSPENRTGLGNDNFLNQNFSAAPITNPIKVPGNATDFRTNTNPSFNTSYISQTLGINGTETKPQYNKPIYQPIIYQPFVTPIMFNAMDSMGMNPYNSLMGYPSMVPYPLMPQFPMMGYSQMGQYPGMLAYPPMEGSKGSQPLPGMQQQGGQNLGQDNTSHFAVMNPNVIKNDNFNNNNNNNNSFASNSNFDQANSFDNNSSFSGQNDFGNENSNFGPTPDFNAAPSFSSSPDFGPPDAFNNNMLGKMDSNKTPFQYDKESSKRKLPVWAIILIVILVVLVLAAITIVMLYFNLKEVHNLINKWFNLEVPFKP